jgi:hypothetical protein
VRKVTQIQPLARRINGTQQPLQPPPQILRADQERLGPFLARFDQANRRTRRQGREKLFLARRIKFESTVEFQHAVRILRGA